MAATATRRCPEILHRQHESFRRHIHRQRRAARTAWWRRHHSGPCCCSISPNYGLDRGGQCQWEAMLLAISQILRDEGCNFDRTGKKCQHYAIQSDPQHKSTLSSHREFHCLLLRTSVVNAGSIAYFGTGNISARPKVRSGSLYLWPVSTTTRTVFSKYCNDT